MTKLLQKFTGKWLKASISHLEILLFRIKEELGDAPKDGQRQGIEGLLKLEKIVGCSLQARYNAVQELLTDWQQQRIKRETAFKSLQAQINSLKLRFGEVVIGSMFDPCKVKKKKTVLK